MKPFRLWGVVLGLLMLAAGSGIVRAQETRDYVSIVGPRSVYPYISAVIEQFGAKSRYKFPKVGTSDTDVSIQLLCAGAGVELPDLALANRKMTEWESRRCQRNGVAELVDMKIGLEAVALVGGKTGGFAGLRAADLFLAIAEKAPDPKAAATAQTTADTALPAPMVANPYQRWNEINPALPDLPIRFLAPPRSSLYWDIFAKGLMEAGCRQIKAVAAMEKADADGFRKICRTLRVDAAVVDAPDVEGELTDELNGQPGTLSVLPLNAARGLATDLTLLAVDGIAPDIRSVNDGSYKPSQPVYLFVKQHNFEIIPGLRDFVSEFIGPRATGETGYLTEAGLVPLTEEERRQMRALVSNLVAPQEQTEGGGGGGAQASAARLREIEADMWEAIKASEDPLNYKVYLKVFPDGLFARAAESRVARLSVLDTDGDGAPDYLDKCPGTRKGVKTDKNGCPVDSDGDGVNDELDPCPDTPKGAAVDRLGCPVDSDRDGTPDYLDKCPDTPLGVAVNEQGCPLDTDGDGVFDSRDDCPDTPPGAAVDKHGCPVDSDRDGAPDYLDKCLDTPLGVAVNEQGCPLDADGDGVFDSRDDCPNTPAGTTVDKYGCPAAGKDAGADADGDGVPDSRDKCPGTPPGAAVDSVGCPVDGDGDGIPNDKDECPGTPKGVKVDEKGCWNIERLYFSPTEGEIQLRHAKVLEDVLKVLKANPGLRLEIQGHSDSGGDPGANIWYATRRAQSAADYFMVNGVNRDRLVVKGMGSDKPAAANDTQQNRQLNRRVEIYPLPIQ